jgi:hypothetical protein
MKLFVYFSLSGIFSFSKGFSGLKYADSAYVKLAFIFFCLPGSCQLILN